MSMEICPEPFSGKRESKSVKDLAAYIIMDSADHEGLKSASYHTLPESVNIGAVASLPSFL